MTQPNILSNPSILTATIKHWQTADYEPPINEPESTRYLTPAQITAFLLAARADVDRDCATLLTCALLSGISAIDLTFAAWEDLDIDGCVLVAHSPLRGDCEWHPLNPPAAALMRRWTDESMYYSALIFSQYSDQIDYDNLVATLDRIASRAGIAALTLDDLQRSHEIIALGVALCDVPTSDQQALTNDGDVAVSQAASLACC